jgi:hypothetical protein
MRVRDSARRWLIPVVACALVLAGARTATAQGHGQKFAAIIGGATLSDLSNYYNDTDTRWGGTAGLLFGANYGRSAPVLEVSWVQKGGQDLSIDYIEPSLTFGGVVPIGQTGAARMRFYGGVSWAFKISCSEEANVVGINDVCDIANGDEWGLPAGLQIAKVSGDKFFGLDVRYNFALSDAIENTDIMNRTWYFRAFFGKAR